MDELCRAKQGPPRGLKLSHQGGTALNVRRRVRLEEPHMGFLDGLKLLVRDGDVRRRLGVRDAMPDFQGAPERLPAIAAIVGRDGDRMRTSEDREGESNAWEEG